MEDLMVWVKVAAYLGAAFAAGIGVMGPALSQGKIGATACENLGKYPESAGKIQTMMLLAMALVESLALFVIVVAFMLAVK